MKTLLVVLTGVVLFVAGCQLIPQTQAKFEEGEHAGKDVFLDKDGLATPEPKDAEGKPHKELQLHDIKKLQEQLAAAEELAKKVPLLGDWLALGIGGLLGGFGVPVLGKVNDARKKKAGLPTAATKKA